MIRVSFLPPDLSRWEGATADAVCLPVFADDRPLRGAAGLVDWRLCGALSRCLLARRVRADEDEVLLVPAGRRLPFSKVLLFGLGPSAGFDDRRYRRACRRIRDVVVSLGVRRFAVAPPGRSREAIAPRRALELLLAEAESAGDLEMLVIEPMQGQKEMAAVLRQGRA